MMETTMERGSNSGTNKGEAVYELRTLNSSCGRFATAMPEQLPVGDVRRALVNRITRLPATAAVLLDMDVCALSDRYCRGILANPTDADVDMLPGADDETGSDFWEWYLRDTTCKRAGEQALRYVRGIEANAGAYDLA